MDNTVFDDAFRTIVEKMPELVVPLINEVFHTHYPEDVGITQLRNEHQDESGEVIADSCLQIGKKIYHIECESTDDATMAVRMIEYDFRISLETADKEGRRYHITFPQSCVLYLRDTAQTPDDLEVDVTMPDGSECLYRIPAVKVGRYPMESLFTKDLQMLLPFYAMRYEREAGKIEEDPKELQRLMEEFIKIREYLDRKFMMGGRPELYTDLVKIVLRVADHIFRKGDKIREGIGEIMGGKVWQLESERLREEGREEGKEAGRAEERERSIGAMVSDNLEEGVGEERILEKLQRWFSLDREQAQTYYERFSGQGLR